MISIEQSAELPHGFTVVTTRGSQEFWASNESKIRALFRQSYPTVSDKSLEELLLQTIVPQRLAGNATLVSLLYDQQDLVGLTYAFPSLRKMSEKEKTDRHLTDEEAVDEEEYTAEAGWALIHPNARERHGWSQLMKSIEQPLRDDGHHTMIRYVRDVIDPGKSLSYADKLSSYYGARVIHQEASSEFNPIIGAQRLLRIALP